MMNSFILKLVFVAGAGLMLAACKTIPEVPHAMGCEVGAQIMAKKCAAPTSITDGATFQALVDTAMADRQALTECGITAEALKASIQKCNQATAEFNRKVDEINKANR